MGRLKDERIRKLQKTGGGSYIISLPIKIVRKLKWKENQKLVVKFDKKRKKFTVEDWKK